MDNYLTISEASKILGVCNTTIRRKIKAGEIRAEVRSSPYGKEQYYINPIELGAVKTMDVIKVEHVMTPDEVMGLMLQITAPLYSKIDDLSARLEARGIEQDERADERDRKLMQTMRDIQQWQKKTILEKITLKLRSFMGNNTTQ
jgi:hypothetical protein